MFDLDVELDENEEMETVFPKFENTLKNNRFWVYETIYNSKISYIVVDMLKRNRYLFFDDNSKFGKVFLLEDGELFDCEYLADFDNWNDFHKEFEELQKMTNLITIVILSYVDDDDESDDDDEIDEDDDDNDDEIDEDDDDNDDEIDEDDDDDEIDEDDDDDDEDGD